MVFSTPEPINSGPCRHCYLDHPDERCPWKDREEDMAVEFFKITIECRQCGSTNCDHYIKEADDDGTWESGHIHVCPYEIRYRCKDCGLIMDRKSD